MSDFRQRAKAQAVKQREQEAKQTQQLKKVEPKVAPPPVAEVQPELTSEPVKGKVREPVKPLPAWLHAAVIAAVVIVIAVTVLLGNRQYNFTYRETKMQLDMERVCRDVFEDNGYPFGQLYNGCQIAAEHSINEYTKEINYCYDNFDQTDAIFLKCLADNDVKISEIWIISAPED